MYQPKPSVRSRGLPLSPAAENSHFEDRHHHAETEHLIHELRSVKLRRSEGHVFADSKFLTTSERALRNLCAELDSLKKAATNEMCQHVYANYRAFISTSQELALLEGEILNMRMIVSEHALLVRGLLEAIQAEFVSDESTIASESVPLVEDSRELSKNTEMLLDNLDICIAERRVDDALALLFEGEEIIMETSKDDQAAESLITHQQMLLSERRERLTEQLVEAVQQPSACQSELYAAISRLCRLDEGTRAHTLLLKVHKQRLLSSVQNLRPSSAPYGGDYTFTLSQFVFSAISQAARDSQSLFGEQAARVSELVLWVSNEGADFASLVERHVLLPAASAGNLHSAVDCVQTALGHCSLLEGEGLMLGPTLLKILRPSVERSMQISVQHIKDSVSALVMVDDWIVASPSSSKGIQSATGSSAEIKISSSAQKLQKLLQDLFEDAVPLVNMQLGGQLLNNSALLLDCYVSMLIKAIPKPRFDNSLNHKDVVLAETEEQQLGLWANASAFSEDLLPREEARMRPQSITSSSRGSETREWKRGLQRSVERLRDLYCQSQVLDLFFNEEGLSNFNADLYLLLEYDFDISQAMPSPLFQELFFKVNKLSKVAGDVLQGRERMTILLLSKLVETFVLFILEDSGFWESIEAGPRSLGKSGLQQFMLDIHFVIQIATQGHYSNRKIRTEVLEIMNRAIESFHEEGIDLYRILPENDWFLEQAAGCISKLSVMNPE